jgi:hypothetical protein
MSRTLRITASVAFVALVAVSLVPPADATATTAVPPGLPHHLGVGVAAHPDASGLTGWMPSTGVPWDYAYQYLAGGVNTGNGWQTWNTGAQFPLWYAKSAASHGYVPVFPYYQLLQSNGPCGGCGEARRDLAHLADPTTMAAYYADFVKLLQRLGPGTYDGIKGFGGTAIVHVEPDLSGYAEQAVLDTTNCYGFCTGAGNDPNHLRASVASSGRGELAGYADTWRGFILALDHLRDVYAPNVLLAYHVSNWASMQDIGSSTDRSLDVTALADTVAAFATNSGVAQWDLVFNDVADRDAGYYKYVYGQPNAFWDRTNTVLPNFSRWESYLGRILADVGRPGMVWQVPVGNQVYRSENNTDGHYQDNRAEYFFGHMQELATIGVIGVLYGSGNGGSTEQFDSKGDGVTNPAPVCTTDGMGRGATVCTGATATDADDDGGYLRHAAAAYYQAPIPVGGTDTTPPPAPTVTAPTKKVTTRKPSYTIKGAAEAGALVEVWRDVNANGALDVGDPRAGTAALAPGSTGFAIKVTLPSGASYRYLVTATDAAGNHSPATATPAITRRAP